MPFGPDFTPLIEPEDPPSPQQIKTFGTGINRPQDRAGQSVITPSLLHTPVLSTSRISAESLQEYSHPVPFSTTNSKTPASNQERPRASLRPNLLEPYVEPPLLSHLLPPNHPPRAPKTKRKPFTQQHERTATSKNGIDSPERSSSTSPVIHAPAPRHIHSLAQPTTISNVSSPRPLQSAPVPDYSHESGMERGWSTAPSVLGGGLSAQPSLNMPYSQPYHLREPAIPRRLKNRRTGPVCSSSKNEALSISRRVFIGPKQIAHASPIDSPSPLRTLLEQSNTCPTVAPDSILVPPPIDSAETVLDDFVVDSAVKYASVGSKSGSRGFDVADRTSKLSNSFLGVFQDLEKYKRFLQYRGEHAQTIIDSIQSLLDAGVVDQPFRVILIVALARLARKSELYPARFFLHDVTRQGGTINEGHFGEIERGVFAGQAVCIKIPRFKTQENSDIHSYRRTLSREIMLWAQICHENILPFYGIFPLRDEYGRFGIVSPFLENGNVIDFLVKNPNVKRPSLIYDVAAGMSHLHDNGLVHGDIKGRNILVTDTVPPRAVLADFGFMTVADTSPGLSSSGAEGGTTQFEAPELLDPDVPYRRTEASDVYAFSMASYEIFSGNVPFPGKRDAHVMVMVGKGERPRKLEGQIYRDQGLDDLMWELMENCWEQVSGQRPKAREILERLSNMH